VRRSLIISAAAVALAMALPAASGAVPRQINVGDDFFSPRSPTARNFSPGPSFRWQSVPAAFSDHNVRQDDRLFSSGRPEDPLAFRINASAGSYHYYCTLHGSRQGGMAGRVKVRPIAVPDSLVGEIEVRWADSNTNTGSRFDVRYKVDQRRWKKWKNDTSGFRAFFGRNDNPVNYNPNRHNYKIKVRSERKRVKKRSDWSPPLRLG
jgi:plastocyanin